MLYSVYILFCDQKTFYIGITNNLQNRLEEHEKGYSNYTKKFSEIRLVHVEYFRNRKIAELRERQLKGWTAAKKKALIENNTKLLKTLSKNPGIVEGRPEE